MTIHFSVLQLRQLIEIHGFANVHKRINGYYRASGKKSIKQQTLKRYAAGKKGYEKGIPEIAKYFVVKVTTQNILS